MANLITEVSRETVIVGTYSDTNNETYQVQYNISNNTVTKFSVTISAKDGSYVGNANYSTSSSSMTVKDQSTIGAHTTIVNNLYAEAVSNATNAQPATTTTTTTTPSE